MLLITPNMILFIEPDYKLKVIMALIVEVEVEDN
jgi:hypothetical protein